VRKDEAVAVVEINSAFTLLREELFVYGLFAFFPAMAFYLKKRREYDEANEEIEEMYRPWSTGKRGFMDKPDKKESDKK